MSQYYSIYVGQTSLISTKVQFLIQLQNTCMINHWSKQTKNFKLGTRDCRNGAFSVCKLLEVLTVDIGAADPFPVLGRLTQHAPPPPMKGETVKKHGWKIPHLTTYSFSGWRSDAEKNYACPALLNVDLNCEDNYFRSWFRLWWYIRIL